MLKQLFPLLTVLTICLLTPSTQADMISVLIGDDDGFAGTQSANSNPGDPFNPNIVPNQQPSGTYLNQTDISTQPPYLPYTFEYTLPYDASSFITINSATVTIQVGSLGRRTDGSGFGFAQVSADDSNNLVNFGDLLTVNTGAAAGNVNPALEEVVRGLTFDVTPIIVTNPTGTLEFILDGSALNDHIDLFSIDFVELTIEGNTIPEPASILVFGSALLLMARRSR